MISLLRNYAFFYSNEPKTPTSMKDACWFDWDMIGITLLTTNQVSEIETCAMSTYWKRKLKIENWNGNYPT